MLRGLPRRKEVGRWSGHSGSSSGFCYQRCLSDVLNKFSKIYRVLLMLSKDYYKNFMSFYPSLYMLRLAYHKNFIIFGAQEL